MTDRRAKITWFAVALWLAAWLLATRHAMLDDCLIHLRYAVNLHRLHMITYDGAHASYGTSSLMYLAILSVLSGLFSSPLLPKIVSDTFYVLLIFLMVRTTLRLRVSPVGLGISAGLLCCMLAPMGVRWLSDGMETGLVVLLMVLMASITEDSMYEQRMPGWHYLLLALFGAFVVLTRIELASEIALASIVILVSQIELRRGLLKSVMIASPMVFGAVCAVCWIYLHFHTLLPDTALAKRGMRSVEVIFSVAHVLASSVLLGVGPLVLWITSAMLLLRRIVLNETARQKMVPWIAGNAGFPVLLLLSYLRGQAIQGVRYVLWALVFSILWNVSELERSERVGSSRLLLSRRGRQWMAAAGVVLLLVMLPVDWRFAWRSMAGRSVTFEAMRSAHLASFEGQTVIAGDVGFIGYFSRGDVCDIDGLVNGREAAKAAPEARLQRCAARGPEMLFLTSSQTAVFGGILDLQQWTVCRHFDFVNVFSEDRHYLMVPAAKASQECPAIGGSAGMRADQVPGLGG